LGKLLQVFLFFSTNLVLNTPKIVFTAFEELKVTLVVIDTVVHLRVAKDNNYFLRLSSFAKVILSALKW
jgi:hypothetical protein